MAATQPQLFQAMAIKSAIRVYAKTGMKVNRAYTPKNMMAMAQKITGKARKARDYQGAIDDLNDWIMANAPQAGEAA